MVFSLSGGDQLGDVVVAEAPAQTERPWFRAVRLGRWRRENLIKAYAKGRVNYFFKGLAQPGRAFLGFGGDVRVKRQSGSHAGIMMSGLRDVNADRGTVPSKATLESQLFII
jgi:hypothetical protein